MLSQQEFGRRSGEHTIAQAIADRLLKKPLKPTKNSKQPKNLNPLLCWDILHRMILRWGINSPTGWSVTVQVVMGVHFKGP